MKSKIKKLEGASREILIEMSKDKVESIFEQVFADIQKTAKMNGFREGKVPMDIVKTTYGADAEDEVKRRVIPEAYQAALKEHNVTPVSFPEVDNVVIEPKGKLTFKVVADVCPEIGLKKYTDIKVKVSDFAVSEKETNEALEHLIGMNAEFADIDRALEKDEFGICDVETFIDGKSISAKRENMWIEANKEASLLGVGEEICGMKKGDVKDIEVTLPENYPDKQYSGKKAIFHVEVKETKNKKLPKLNDEFAKKLGKDSIDLLRVEVETQLKGRKEVNSQIKMKNQIIEDLLKKHSFELPPSMVKRQLKVLIERAENELKSKGVEKNLIDEHKEKMKEQFTKEAQDKVKLYFILDGIAMKENVEVSEEEVDLWFQSLAASFNKPLEEVKKYYSEHDLLGGVMEQLREDKTLDLLLTYADVKK